MFPKEKSPNDLAELISEKLRWLDIAVDIFEENNLMDTFRRRIGVSHE